MTKYSKNILFRLICWVQICLLLISTIGLSVDVHYCQGKVKSIGFFASAEKCEQDKIQKDCHNSAQEQITKKPCCHNFNYYFHSEELADKGAVTSDIKTYSVAQAGQVATVINLPESNRGISLIEGKAPPLKVIDRNILYNTFLL